MWAFKKEQKVAQMPESRRGGLAMAG